MRGFDTFDIQNVTVHLMLNGGVSVYNIFAVDNNIIIIFKDMKLNLIVCEADNNRTGKIWNGILLFPVGPLFCPSSIEKLQFFACKISTKDWSSDYPTLLSKLHLPTLSCCHRNLELITLYKILNNFIDLPFSLPTHSSYNQPQVFSSSYISDLLQSSIFS